MTVLMIAEVLQTLLAGATDASRCHRAQRKIAVTDSAAWVADIQQSELIFCRLSLDGTVVEYRTKSRTNPDGAAILHLSVRDREVRALLNDRSTIATWRGNAGSPIEVSSVDAGLTEEQLRTSSPVAVTGPNSSVWLLLPRLLPGIGLTDSEGSVQLWSNNEVTSVASMRIAGSILRLPTSGGAVMLFRTPATELVDRTTRLALSASANSLGVANFSEFGDSISMELRLIDLDSRRIRMASHTLILPLQRIQDAERRDRISRTVNGVPDAGLRPHIDSALRSLIPQPAFLSPFISLHASDAAVVVEVRGPESSAKSVYAIHSGSVCRMPMSSDQYVLGVSSKRLWIGITGDSDVRTIGMDLCGGQQLPEERLN